MSVASKIAAATVVAACFSTTLTACGSGDDGGRGNNGPASWFSQGSPDSNPDALVALSSSLPRETTVVPELAETGTELSEQTLASASIVVVAADSPDDQARGASVAIGLGAPLLTVDSADDELTKAVAQEIERLEPEHVVTVGETGDVAGGSTRIVLPTGIDEVKKATGIDFTAEKDVPKADLSGAVVHLDRSEPVLLRVPSSKNGKQKVTVRTNFAGTDGTAGTAEVSPYSGPSLSPGNVATSSDKLPLILVTRQTAISNIATARILGADVKQFRAPDPRVDGESVKAVAERGDRSILALGAGWGDAETLDERVELSASVPELPGGGQLVFPGRRMVAAYGSPITSALGVLGEQSPKDSAARVKELVKQYQPYSPETVIPAFEIIATVASEYPGEDGNYTNEWDPKEFVPLIEAITEAGGYAVIDLQPGMATLLDQAKPFKDLLTRPNVGLALDPEWKLKPGQRPGAQIGSVDASEINEVISWLADLTKESGGPQKLLILHQFNMSMIDNRDKIDTSRAELAISLHADGHGSRGMKFETWDVLRRGLDPKIWMAWKNFYDEDSPTFTPQETMDVVPRPWFVSYQ